ncbi:MAG TPA: bacillithiol system redox-active protein YtxJ [Vicinamibacterales bacterium]|nr:bacillithiol system redox-active protein YtxJ [Vicinamibacterales bacterium]
MHNLRSPADLDEAIARSHEQPVVIFKHSATCGTSAMAHEEIEAFVDGAPWADVFVVSVHGGRAVSNEIAARFGVRHESPQALVIKNGELVWHASHFRVTSSAVAAALAKAGAPPSHS